MQHCGCLCHAKNSRVFQHQIIHLDWRRKIRNSLERAEKMDKSWDKRCAWVIKKTREKKNTGTDCSVFCSWEWVEEQSSEKSACRLNYHKEPELEWIDCVNRDMWGTNQHGQLSLNSSAWNNQVQTSAHRLQYLQLLYMQHSHTYGVSYIQRNVILTGFPLLRSEQKRHTESDTTTFNRLGQVTEALPWSRWQPVTHHGLGELCNTLQQPFRTSL